MDVRRFVLVLPLACSLTVGLLGCEPESPVGPGRAPATSRLGISKDGKTLYVALADHDLVRAVDEKSGEIKGEVHVDGMPHRLAVLEDGRVAVTSRTAGTTSRASR
jgi:DNA-binding beta-propeller fold protein YncE